MDTQSSIMAASKVKKKNTVRRKAPDAFPFPGNQFWQLRSKHGRDKLFKSPALLWHAACEYFQWCEDNPIIEMDFVGKDAYEVERKHSRPFTYEGMYSYLGVNKEYLNDFELGLKGKKDAASRDFSVIITRIRQTIYRQKFEGAACGIYNANIIARDLGLIDKTDSEQRVKLIEPITGIKIIRDGAGI